MFLFDALVKQIRFGSLGVEHGNARIVQTQRFGQVMIDNLVVGIVSCDVWWRS